MITFNTLSTAEYQALRYDILLNVEENGNPKFLPYADSEGIPTIGVGFNLQDSFTRAAVLKVGFGFDLLQPYDKAYENEIISIVSALYDNSDLAQVNLLRTQLNDVIARRDADPDVPSSAKFHTSFEFLDVAEINTVFQSLADNVYELRVKDWLSGIPESTERAVLLSLAWNGVLGPNLRTAISTNNRAEAWYEIRYRSNGNQLPGIAKRRYYESQLFSLYDEGVNAWNINDEQAKEVYRMFTKHRETIMAYEATYSSQIALANSDYGVNIDEQVRAINESMGPAYTYIINTYAADTGITIDWHDISVAEKDGDILTGIIRDGDTYGAGLEVNDLMLGSDMDDVMLGGGGSDVLHGGGGNDYLEGGTGDDHLNGGSGHDIYVINAGEGTDHIVDSGANTIVVNGTPVTHLISDDAGGYILKGTTITATHNSSLTITDSSGAGASVVGG